MRNHETVTDSMKKYNFLIFLVDQQRFPPVYESPAITAWRKEHLVTQELLRRHGMEFECHYVGSCACSPSRATLFTGQYPSLHGVSQTYGVAKGAFDSTMFWLDRNTVPTMGHFFRAAGYRTFYKGKWHISDEDIIIPGTHTALTSYEPASGVPDMKKEELYFYADRLDGYGFSGWIGPEPHGTAPHNSGSSAALGVNGRDMVYASQAVELIKKLDEEKASMSHFEKPQPWLLVASFVNPHDIALYGVLTALHPYFRFEVDSSVPPVEPPPTFLELLLTKPRCQSSYREIYPQALQPIINEPFYRRLYYQLQKNADQQMLKVFLALYHSSLYQDTIVLFTADHGELLGAHGGLHQKWYCAYEEAIHVPFIVHNPTLFEQPEKTDMLTSHVDILPTLLGLAEIQVDEMEICLRHAFSEVHPLVGRDLSPLILGTGEPERAGEPLYFMTDDDVTRGQHQTGPLGNPYKSVWQPNHIETVIARLHLNDQEELWKYSRYYDDPQFWSEPGSKDEILDQKDEYMDSDTGTKYCLSSMSIKTEPLPDEYEMYNLTSDPLETTNLADPAYATPESKVVQKELEKLLAEQRKQKRLTPARQASPGTPFSHDER